MAVRIDATLEQLVIDGGLARAFGKLRIACNHAGVPMHGTRLIDLPPGDWEFVMGVNIGGSLRHPPFRRCVSIAEHVQDSTKPRCNAPPR
jgi:hypothetical protein